MPIPEKYLAKLEENRFYHILNHAVANNVLFARQENYRYFMEKFDEYLSDWVEIDAWCLMNNHFHFLIKVRCIVDLSVNLKTQLSKFESLNDCIVNQFKNFFISYSMSFNKENSRRGSLFEKPFKRIWVNSKGYYTRLVYYIHANPRHHLVMYDFQNYTWSSYLRILQTNLTKLRKKEVLAWFGGEQGYIDFHARENVSFEGMQEYLMEE